MLVRVTRNFSLSSFSGALNRNYNWEILAVLLWMNVKFCQHIFEKFDVSCVIRVDSSTFVGCESAVHLTPMLSVPISSALE